MRAIYESNCDFGVSVAASCLTDREFVYYLHRQCQTLIGCYIVFPIYSTHWCTGWVLLDPTHARVQRREMFYRVPDT